LFFAELPRVLFRRWYVLLVGILATGVMASLAMQHVQPGYQARAELLLLPPKTAVPEGSNPYLVLGGLEGMGGVLSTALMSDPISTELKRAASGGDYIVGLDQTSPAPLLLVIVTTKSPEQSMQALRLILDRVAPTLAEIQRNTDVKAGSFITSAKITQSTKPTVLRKAQLRAVLAVLALGMVLATLLTAAVDSLVMRGRPTERRPAFKRRSRQRPERGDAGDELPDDGLVDTAAPEPLRASAKPKGVEAAHGTHDDTTSDDADRPESVDIAPRRDNDPSLAPSPR
jgi:hypothetical protein